jgi:hypothetical protein
MSSFERRGLPFRDVFDSSFDTIIYVDYLDFAGAQDLIEKRIVGKPIPFFALSYCLSGGLARDMIRIFRSLFELRQSAPEKNDLKTLCHALVTADVKAKLRAAAVAAKKIELPAEVEKFLAQLYQVESTLLSEDALWKAVGDICPPRAADAQRAGAKDEEKEVAAEREKLNSLRGELATYLYYMLTVVQFFKNTLNQDALTREDEHGKIDYLARARQMLAVNPSITRIMLNNFRVAHSLGECFSLAATAAPENGDESESQLSAALMKSLHTFLNALSAEEKA